MAYLRTTVSGNPEFGGYLSVDGGKSIPVKDDMTYELEDGQHLFELHSTPDWQRKMGKFQNGLNSMTSSSGKILDAVYEKQASDAIGDTWRFQVVAQEGQLIEISVLSKGEKIIADPMYNVTDLELDVLADLQARFAEIHKREEEYANTPRRSGKQIAIGIALIVLFGGALIMSIQESGSVSVAVLVTVLGVVAVGVLLLVLGLRKKIR